MSANVYSAGLPTPPPDESQALVIAASYLNRAGTTTATVRLSLTLTPDRDLLLALLRDSMLAA